MTPIPGIPDGLWPWPAPAPRAETRSDAERNGVLRRGFFIDYPAAEPIRTALREFIERPWIDGQRWRGLILAGEPRSGRSWLLSTVLPNRHPWSAEAPVVYLPDRTTDGAIVAAIADAIGSGHRTASGGRAFRAETLGRLGQTKAIAFDAGERLTSMSRAQVKKVLATVKSICEERRIPGILVVPPKVLSLIKADKDWGARFEELHMPEWRVDADYLALLTAWEAALPLQKTSYLADQDLALHLFALCDGNIARLDRVLREGALAAIESATEKISISLLDNLGFAPPPDFSAFR